MKLPIDHDFAPMEAITRDELPAGKGWQFEPKWDGFRCLVFRDGDSIELRSKSGQPLTRYFPELVAAIAALAARCFVLDGEIVVPVGSELSFDALLQRIHPAESRIERLSGETPARLMIFDLLVDEKGESWVHEPLVERRRRLESFAKDQLARNGTIRLSPVTTSAATARRWLAGAGKALDGVIAKERDQPYRTGERAGMIKIKRKRTADCVVGGFRYSSTGKGIGSMLLGLFDADGLLHHVGFTTLAPKDRVALQERLEDLEGGPGFTGQAPGGPSRWARGRSTEWVPLEPELVVEVEYDHFSGGRFRHGTRLLRFRPDKPAAKCTMDQIQTGAAFARRLKAA